MFQFEISGARSALSRIDKWRTVETETEAHLSASANKMSEANAVAEPPPAHKMQVRGRLQCNRSPNRSQTEIYLPDHRLLRVCLAHLRAGTWVRVVIYRCLVSSLQPRVGCGLTRFLSRYFSTVTMTTVGYGDLLPTSAHGRAFTIGFVLLGVTVTGRCISNVSQWLVAKYQTLQAAKAAEILNKSRVITSMAGNAVLVLPMPTVKKEGTFVVWLQATKQLRGVLRLRQRDLDFYIQFLYKMWPMMITLTVAAATIGAVEGWDPVDSIYFMWVTASTIGYGDVTPKSQAGRLIMVFVIPLVVSTFLNVTNNLAHLVLEYAQGKVRLPTQVVLTLTLMSVLERSADL